MKNDRIIKNALLIHTIYGYVKDIILKNNKYKHKKIYLMIFVMFKSSILLEIFEIGHKESSGVMK